MPFDEGVLLEMVLFNGTEFSAEFSYTFKAHIDWQVARVEQRFETSQLKGNVRNQRLQRKSRNS